MTSVSGLLAAVASGILTAATALMLAWFTGHRGTDHPPYMDGLYCLGCTVRTVAGALSSDWYAIVWAVLAVIFGVYWWHQRRNRKRRRAALALGAKSLALRDALVRRARQSARPSPVLRPSLRGAS